MPNNSSDWSAKQTFNTTLRLAIAQELSLPEVYPNPFSSTTAISFSLQEDSHAHIELYDLEGRKLQTLLDENLHAGNHSMQINREKLSAGIYLVHTKVNDQSFTIKIIVE